MELVPEVVVEEEWWRGHVVLLDTIVVGENETGTEVVGIVWQDLILEKEHEMVEVRWNNS